MNTVIRPGGGLMNTVIRPGGDLMNTVIRPGGGLINTVISYASGKPSDPLRGYSYAHDSNFDRPAISQSRCTK